MNKCIQNIFKKLFIFEDPDYLKIFHFLKIYMNIKKKYKRIKKYKSDLFKCLYYV